MDSIVFPVERSSLTVLDMLDSRYMAPGGQLHGRQMEAQFRKLEQECRGLQSMLMKAGDTSREGGFGGGAAAPKRDVLRPLYAPTSPRIPARRDSPPAKRGPAGAGASPRDAGLFGGAPMRESSPRPESAHGRMLKTSRSAAAALGYYDQETTSCLTRTE